MQKSGFTGEVFICRFSNLFEVALDYAKRYGGFTEQLADLSGILYGYPSVEVANYCLDDRMKKYKLIKV